MFVLEVSGTLRIRPSRGVNAPGTLQGSSFEVPRFLGWILFLWGVRIDCMIISLAWQRQLQKSPTWIFEWIRPWTCYFFPSFSKKNRLGKSRGRTLKFCPAFTVNLQHAQGPERLAFLYFKVLVTSKVIRRFSAGTGKMGPVITGIRDQKRAHFLGNKKLDAKLWWIWGISPS